jgi:hypothetical protein
MGDLNVCQQISISVSDVKKKKILLQTVVEISRAKAQEYTSYDCIKHCARVKDGICFVILNITVVSHTGISNMFH